MLPLKIKKFTVSFQSPFYKCYRVFAEFVGFNKNYYVVDFNKTVAIICINSRDEVLLTKQYRFLINKISLEIAGGGLDPDEDFSEGAFRELLEETGYEANELISLCEFRPGLDNVDNPTKIFLCTSYEKKFNIVPNPREILGIEWIHIDKCLQLIAESEIQDGTSIIGIALAKNYLDKNLLQK